MTDHQAQRDGAAKADLHPAPTHYCKKCGTFCNTPIHNKSNGQQCGYLAYTTPLEKLAAGLFPQRQFRQ